MHILFQGNKKKTQLKGNIAYENFGLITASVDCQSLIHPTMKTSTVFCCIAHITSYSGLMCTAVCIMCE